MNYFLAALSKYATFSGRARRAEYWYFTLFYLIIYFILVFIDTTIGTGFLAGIFSLAMFLPSIAVGVRRMHDVGKSGWFILIPIYNLILACTAGDVGPNEYGEDPKGGSLYGESDYVKPSDADTNSEI